MSPRSDPAPLGQPAFSGTIAHGDGRARTLGSPTADLAVPAGAHAAAVPVGQRSTSYRREGERPLEAHLIDFRGDPYGRNARVDPTRRPRSRRRSHGTEELLAQPRRGILTTRAWMPLQCPPVGAHVG
ncbi:MAG: bifunctional riboflavin kinase/FMN adenylyltransferase [Modestobacter sp.]|jgi:FAD synthase|nr:bifunctional riboflavin kinase/FMN adenylyltransferase [Modestobacter sp.]